MKILVVGGAGYIGSVCAELLLDEGHEVGVFDNLSEGHRRAVDSRAAFIEGDLAERERIQATLADFQPEAVMHFAASALVGESMENPSKYFRNNIAHGLNLLDAMVATGVNRIVFSSTCATFGPPERVPINETAPQRPMRSGWQLASRRAARAARAMPATATCAGGSASACSASPTRIGSRCW